MYWVVGLPPTNNVEACQGLFGRPTAPRPRTGEDRLRFRLLFDTVLCSLLFAEDDDDGLADGGGHVVVAPSSAAPLLFSVDGGHVVVAPSSAAPLLFSAEAPSTDENNKQEEAQVDRTRRPPAAPRGASGSNLTGAFAGLKTRFDRVSPPQ